MGRDPNSLHPELRTCWEKSAEQWNAAHPELTVILTQALRTHKEQDALYAQGRTRPGKIVTNARGGQSLHNYGLAFDVAFRAKDGTIDWNDLAPFREFAVIAKSNGLAWGGDWKRKDYPHFEAPGMTWQKAKAGEVPKWGPLSQSEETAVCECCGRPLP